MKVYIVIARKKVQVVTTNKEKAEAVAKDWNKYFNMVGEYDTATVTEKEVED
jgi:hypothetical protein